MVSRSSLEAEYQAMALTTVDITCLCWLVTDMGFTVSGLILHCDNTSAV